MINTEQVAGQGDTGARSWRVAAVAGPVHREAHSRRAAGEVEVLEERPLLGGAWVRTVVRRRGWSWARVR